MSKKQSNPTPESVLDEAIAVMHDGIATIRAELDKIKNGKGEKSRHDKASRVAFLAVQAGKVADSLRKAESARNKRLDALTMAMVLEWARALPATEKAQLVREIEHMTQKRSGLA